MSTSLSTSSKCEVNIVSHGTIFKALNINVIVRSLLSNLVNIDCSSTLTHSNFGILGDEGRPLPRSMAATTVSRHSPRSAVRRVADGRSRSVHARMSSPYCLLDRPLRLRPGCTSHTTSFVRPPARHEETVSKETEFAFFDDAEKLGLYTKLSKNTLIDSCVTTADA